MDQTLPANWSITVENTRPTYRGDNPAQPVAANAVSVRGDASWNGTIAEGERQHLTAEITFHTPGIYRVTANGVILAWEDTPGFCCGTTHTFQVLYNGTTLFLSRGAGFCHQDYRLHPDTFRCEQRNSTTADAENTPY